MYEVRKNKKGKYAVYKDNAKRASKVFSSEKEAQLYVSRMTKKKTAGLKKRFGVKGFVLVVLLIVCILGFFFIKERFFSPDTPKQTIVFEDADLKIHFLELGNEYTGDCTYIKAGDVDILIDAGSRKDSAPVIKKYLDRYLEDDTLEYVIATHGDQDHIAAFVGNKSGSTQTGILYQYQVDTIITASRSNKTTAIYRDFTAAVSMLETNGTNHYTAEECWNNENGAKRRFQITDEIYLDILWNQFYFTTTSDENNYSVCVMLSYFDQHFMFTGDLEKEGEEAMAAYYDGSSSEKTLPHVALFKAGHHGSKTSSNDCLLQKITPEIVCVCCCAGGSEYTANYNNVFPTQEMITRVARYTDQIYVTSLYNENTLQFQSFNGNITVYSDGNGVDVIGSNHSTILKDSDWFNEKVYVIGNNRCSGKGKKDFYTKDTPGAIEVIRRVWPTI